MSGIEHVHSFPTQSDRNAGKRRGHCMGCGEESKASLARKAKKAAQPKPKGKPFDLYAALVAKGNGGWDDGY